MDTRKEGFAPASQRFMQLPSTSTNTNVRPPETTVRPPETTASSNVRPVNYSIQTGEEFALEFMRERAVSKKPSGDQNYATGYMDLRGMLGISQTGSESGSDVSMLMSGDRTHFKEIEKSNTSEIENKGCYASSRSAPRALSGISGYSSSGAPDSSSKKMKVLCSFGGKILPRPSDSKLRYVGGDTRIIRISRDITWQELIQKTLAVYNQPHTIKYQLPGEDLDALVSVSCDEDLQNMMEECSFLEGGEGSQKLRMFLFSNDIDDTHYSLGSMDGDSEIQYVVAVNGIDPTMRTSSEPGLATSSASNMDQLLNLTVEVGRDAPNRVVTESAGIQTVPFSGNFVTPTTVASQLQASLSSEYDAHFHPYQAQRVQYVEGEQYPFSTIHPPDNFQNTNSRISIPGSVPSDYAYNSQYAPSRGTSAPVLDNLLSAQESKPTVDNSTLQKSESENIQHLNNEFTTSQQLLHDVSISKHNGKQQEPGPQSSPNDAYTDHDSEFNEDDQYASGFSDYDSIGADPPARPARVFHSERIPREQAESMNRLSKSDDSIGSQFLMLQSQSGAVHVSTVEGADPLPEGNVVSHKVRSPIGKPPLPTSTTIEDGLQQFEKYKELANTITQTNKLEPVQAQPAVSQEEPSIIAPERKDILIDINDRFPRDLLSDIFSKARIAQDSFGLTPLRKGDAGISVNMQNHEPQRWSFFRNLAQDEFARKDISLMDQDHVGVPRPYEFGALESKGVDLGHMNSPVEFDEDLQQEILGTTEDNSNILHPGHIPSQAAHHGEGLQENSLPRGATDSAYEEVKFAIGEASGPVLDASVGDIDLSNLQLIKNEDLEELKELGSGTFGTVYHGKWRGSDVAIKRIKKSCFTGRSSEQERLTNEFWREAEILSKLHHPNVVAFYGVVQDGPGGTLATVTEFMVNGSLRHVLLRKDKYLDFRKRLIIAMDAAFGMEYLHSKNIVHFDLKCDNLLVNLKDQSRPICKVGDFGLSKIKRNTLVSGGVRGTLPWMAPELLNGSSNKVSEKVDVFSFGIVMWEILTGEEPYANMHYGAIIGGIVNNTLRPPVPGSCDPEWRRLMEQCWAPDPQQRPSFTQIASRLRSMSVACQMKANK
ncbi:uncharacterized protein A4U43_C08F27010 [Asparagus officinalis]|uniref:uncharacterized protein LOC109822392 n=1 Tax=Asparagus officinalis TaxID=4686 RepID=UPI00098E21CC|nr:uncharacterized protein LOC109822392 [Asparagus officinalis]ONK61176.1 uncharacterized protein A4U43_C08F27010 [Asparagus officinalis]